ncbi:hypothetical protein Ahy_A08g040260 [Arachis hypogaea]|uniref:Aminotransferase-like plant mobile domain-containing protein n=1 Tax=Arachis hypogaea TaxID=3818 RepID=A0A445BYQ9_ARAHY|nr:hypothetical protein Ahy_A08g040260 [Arachis hypogaea]
MTDKSNNLVHLRWPSLLADFQTCRGLSWGSAVLAWTYHSLRSAAHRALRFNSPMDVKHESHMFVTLEAKQTKPKNSVFQWC